ncbi:MAG: uncharacterized protein A8A55_1040 [Amphiamblys sp. WSBS2006]|nr:MAG: uncharacterized protein A8A55_1040 [Amphiamblys sp. WSBS2006]
MECLMKHGGIRRPIRKRKYDSEIIERCEKRTHRREFVNRCVSMLLSVLVYSVAENVASGEKESRPVLYTSLVRVVFGLACDKLAARTVFFFFAVLEACSVFGIQNDVHRGVVLSAEKVFVMKTVTNVLDREGDLFLCAEIGEQIGKAIPGPVNKKHGRVLLVFLVSVGVFVLSGRKKRNKKNPKEILCVLLFFVFPLLRHKKEERTEGGRVVAGLLASVLCFVPMVYLAGLAVVLDGVLSVLSEKGLITGAQRDGMEGRLGSIARKSVSDLLVAEGVVWVCVGEAALATSRSFPLWRCFVLYSVFVSVYLLVRRAVRRSPEGNRQALFKPRAA